MADLFATISIISTIVLLILTKPIVALMSTPVEAVLETEYYLMICFIGIPFITAYNIISSVFRGMGDSKSPMYFIAIACVSNIILDYIFIGGMGLGVIGAALGTVLSQTISVVISLFVIVRQKNGIKLLLYVWLCLCGLRRKILVEKIKTLIRIFFIIGSNGR